MMASKSSKNQCIVADAEALQAARDIDAAIRNLRASLVRVPDILSRLSSEDALNSDGARSKYQEGLVPKIKDFVQELDNLNDSLPSCASNFINAVDEIDDFVY